MQVDPHKISGEARADDLQRDDVSRDDPDAQRGRQRVH
jgi:hypothetical protein